MYNNFMGNMIVYPVRDINFKILIKCPVCHSDLSPKKRIEDNKSLEKIQSTEIQLYNFQEMKEYIQICPSCKFKMHYVNCIHGEKQIREIKNLNKIENKKYIGVS
jgi:hypothetical protein